MGKVLPGQKANISARTFNSFVDAAEFAKSHAHDRAVKSIGGGTQQSGVIFVRNETGGRCGQFEVLGLGDPVITPAQNEDEFCEHFCMGAGICDSDDARNLVVLLEPLEDGAIGRAVAVGVTPVFMVRDTGEDSTTAGTIADDTILQAGGFGAQIIWEAPGGTTPHLALVRIPSTEPASGGVLMAQLQSVVGDYLSVKLWNGTSWDTNAVNVAKPYLLRQSITSRGGVSYTYTNGYTRTATQGGNTENQVIVPSYTVGDTLFVADAGATGVTVGNPLTLVDLNVDGRAWAKQ